MCDDMTAGTINKNTGIRDRQMASTRRQAFRDGVRDGMPIALGYLAVSFTLGTAIQKAGMTAFQGMLASLLNNASAGEYVGFALIAAGASYWEVALLTLITNARYLLMSCALSQKFAPGAPLIHRLLVGYDVTDEIFGISIARPGYLNPYYNYGAMAVAMPGWALSQKLPPETPVWHRMGVGFGITDEIFAISMARPGGLEPGYAYGAMAIAIPCWAMGTALGITAGNILPLRVVSALSVALYGMFLAVIIPPARNDKVVAGLVLLSFAASFLSVHLPALAGISGGTRTILLTVVIAGAAAVLFPIDRDEVSDKEVQ